MVFFTVLRRRMTEILRAIGNGISTRPRPDSNQFPCKHNSHVTRAHALLTKSTENVGVFNSTWSGYVILFFNIYLLIFNTEKSLHIVLRIAKQSDLIVVVVLQTISYFHRQSYHSETYGMLQKRHLFCQFYVHFSGWFIIQSIFLCFTVI